MSDAFRAVSGAFHTVSDAFRVVSSLLSPQSYRCRLAAAIVVRLRPAASAYFRRQPRESGGTLWHRCTRLTGAHVPPWPGRGLGRRCLKAGQPPQRRRGAKVTAVHPFWWTGGQPSVVPRSPRIPSSRPLGLRIGVGQVRVALITDGGFPFARRSGGTWCEQLVRGLACHEFGVDALRPGDDGPLPLPPNVTEVRVVPPLPPAARPGRAAARRGAWALERCLGRARCFRPSGRR